jgi:hypothetical protein
MVRRDDPAGISRCFRTRRGEGTGRFRFSVVAFGHRVLNRRETPHYLRKTWLLSAGCIINMSGFDLRQAQGMPSKDYPA